MPHGLLHLMPRDVGARRFIRHSSCALNTTGSSAAASYERDRHSFEHVCQAQGHFEASMPFKTGAKYLCDGGGPSACQEQGAEDKRLARCRA